MEKKSPVPRHVGVIMDGNGRWAQERGLPRPQGHRAGVERLHDIVRLSEELGVEVLSVYAFSTENWKRPQAEVQMLMALLGETFAKEIDELDARGVRIRVLGALAGLPGNVRDIMQNAMDRTAGNTGIQFNVAFNYGGRAEVLRAVQNLAREVRDGVIAPEDIDEAELMDKLYTAGQPDPDLIIRTGGEMRMSNFLLLQAAYAELYFTDTYWPDFSDEEYKKALSSFGSRERRYGGVRP